MADRRGRGGWSLPASSFWMYVDRTAGGRLWLATLCGGAGVLLISRWSHSSAAGYGYGGLLFLVLSWPLGRHVWRALRWRPATIPFAILLVIASVGMGSWGDWLLGFNPQATGMHRFSGLFAQKLLWQFPLLLPVENLILLGGLIALWQTVRPRGRWEGIMVAIAAAFLFGLWHVPAWGGWTMVSIGLTVIPWTVYLVATGDMVVPMVAHVVMDTMAVLGTSVPKASVWHVLALPALLVALLVLGLVGALMGDRAPGGGPPGLG